MAMETIETGPCAHGNTFRKIEFRIYKLHRTVRSLLNEGNDSGANK